MQIPIASIKVICPEIDKKVVIAGLYYDLDKALPVQSKEQQIQKQATA